MIKKNIRRLLFVLIVLGLVNRFVTAQDKQTAEHWPQFRGPNGHAIANNQKVPTEFNESNTLWKRDIPKGSSSPIIWDNKLFLTASLQNKLLVLCYDRRTGNELWRRELKSEFTEDYHHEDCTPAAATSCCNGKQLISSFGTFGLIAHDLLGNELWRYKIKNRSQAFGSGSSPILYEGDVFFLRDSAEYSALISLDAKTGKIKWRSLRNAFTSSYSTPYVWKHSGRTELIVAGSGSLDSYDPKTGKRIWTVKGLPAFVCPSPVAFRDRLIFGAWTTAHVSGAERTRTGFGKDIELTDLEATNADAFIKRFDKDKNGKLLPSELPESRSRDAFAFLDHDKSGDWDRIEIQGFFERKPAKGKNILVAVKAGGGGDITSTHVEWKSTRNLPYVSSPLIYRNRVYCVKKGGSFASWDLDTGKMNSEMRLPTKGEYYATPIAIGDHIMLAAERGDVVFISVKGEEPKIVSKNSLNQNISATPAVIGGTIYIRTAKQLFAIQN